VSPSIAFFNFKNRGFFGNLFLPMDFRTAPNEGLALPPFFLLLKCASKNGPLFSLLSFKGSTSLQRPELRTLSFPFPACRPFFHERVSGFGALSLLYVSVQAFLFFCSASGRSFFGQIGAALFFLSLRDSLSPFSETSFPTPPRATKRAGGERPLFFSQRDYGPSLFSPPLRNRSNRLLVVFKPRLIHLCTLSRCSRFFRHSTFFFLPFSLP